MHSQRMLSMKCFLMNALTIYEFSDTSHFITFESRKPATVGAGSARPHIIPLFPNLHKTTPPPAGGTPPKEGNGINVPNSPPGRGARRAGWSKKAPAPLKAGASVIQGLIHPHPAHIRHSGCRRSRRFRNLRHKALRRQHDRRNACRVF